MVPCTTGCKWFREIMVSSGRLIIIFRHLPFQNYLFLNVNGNYNKIHTLNHIILHCTMYMILFLSFDYVSIKILFYYYYFIYIILFSFMCRHISLSRFQSHLICQLYRKIHRDDYVYYRNRSFLQVLISLITLRNARPSKGCICRNFCSKQFFIWFNFNGDIHNNFSDIAI